MISRTANQAVEAGNAAKNGFGVLQPAILEKQIEKKQWKLPQGLQGLGVGSRA